MSCLNCTKRRVKCNKQIPCDVCIRRGFQASCKREKVIIGGKVVNDEVEEMNLKKEQELESTVSVLRNENSYLKARLAEFEGQERLDRSKSAEMKPTEYGLFGKSVSLITRQLDVNDNSVEYNFNEFQTLCLFLTYERSLMLVKYNFDKIYFLHCVVVPEIFLQEHESFYLNGGKHFSAAIDKTRDEYLWLSIYYGLIANSLLLLDEKIVTQLETTEQKINKLGEIAIYASLECLNRGQFLKFPNLNTLQVFGILVTSSHIVLGVNFQNNLLSCCITIAKTINLHKLVEPVDQLNLLNFEMSCRIWWLLVVVDWFEDSSENISCQINANEFSTPLPRNINDFNLMNSIERECDNFIPITYNFYMYKLAEIKRRFYYNNKINTFNEDLIYLDYAYDRVNQIENEMKQKFKVTDLTKHIRELLIFKLNHEKLNIKKQNIDLKYHNNMEISKDIEICDQLGTELIHLFNNPEFPSYYKKYWMVSEHSINGSIFLLVNMILNQKAISLSKIKTIEMLLLNLRKFLSLPNNPISKGITIIKKLLEIISKKINNDFHKLEIIEVQNILDGLNNFQKIYDYESFSLEELIEDDYWVDFLSWVTTENLSN